MYELNTISDVEEAMKNIKMHQPEMLADYTVEEIIQEGAVMRLLPQDLANKFLEAYNRGEVCLY